MRRFCARVNILSRPHARVFVRARVLYLSSAREEKMKSEEEDLFLFFFFFVSREEKTFRANSKEREKGRSSEPRCLSLSLLQVLLRLNLRLFTMILILILILMYVTLRARTANLLVTGSRCRGGIVNILGGCSRAHILWRQSPMALWRFRVSTSNSPSGHWRPHLNTQMC